MAKATKAINEHLQKGDNAVPACLDGPRHNWVLVHGPYYGKVDDTKMLRRISGWLCHCGQQSEVVTILGGGDVAPL